MLLPELGDQAGQQVAAQGGAGAQAQLTGTETGELGQVAFGSLFQREDALGIGQQALAGFGEADAAGLAVEQGQLQAAFQFADLAGHGRLADEQARRAAADAAGLGDGEKDLEVVQIHK